MAKKFELMKQHSMNENRNLSDWLKPEIKGCQHFGKLMEYPFTEYSVLLSIISWPFMSKEYWMI